MLAAVPTALSTRPKNETEIQTHICAFADVWSEAWVEHLESEYRWSADRNKHLLTFGEVCDWDEHVFAVAIAAFHRAEPSSQWDRPTSLGKAAHNASDWVNQARASIAASAREHAESSPSVSAPLAPPPDMKASVPWMAALESAQGDIDPSDIAIWLRKAVPVQVDGEVLTLWFENQDYCDWVEEHYTEALSHHLNGLRVVCISGQQQNYQRTEPDTEEGAAQDDAAAPDQLGLWKS